MKRSVLYIAVASTVFVAGFRHPALAQRVPAALTDAHPALTTLASSTVFVAWQGDAAARQIWYTTEAEGTGDPWTSQEAVSGSASTSAPALATAAAGTSPAENVYLAWRDSTSGIDFSVWNGAKFPGSPFQTITGAQTTAAPALAGSTTTASSDTLYAAWTTESGTVTGISYATYTGGGPWTTFPLPVPGAYPKSTTGPTLAVFNNELYLAWVTTSDTIWYVSAPLPFSGSWSSPAAVPGAVTGVAPALGVFSQAGYMHPAPQLYLAWTTDTAPYHIDLSEWNGSVWNPATEPSLSGTLANLSPALNTYNVGASCEPTSNYFNMAYTLTNADIDYTSVADSLMPANPHCGTT